MKPEEKFSFLMLFCALLLVRDVKATLGESLSIVPLAGNAERLAEQLIAHE